MGIKSFFNKEVANTISVNNTKTTCKLTTKCSDYISNNKTTEQCNNELIDNIVFHLANNKITKPCAIIDKTFYLEVLIDRNTYIYFEDEFKEVKDALEINENTNILFINTEGNTDVQVFNEIISNNN